MKARGRLARPSLFRRFQQVARRRRIPVLPLVILFSLALIVVLAVFLPRPETPANRGAILKLWDSGDYAGVGATATALEARPLDPFFLAMRGLSSFYRGIGLSDGAERSALLDSAVIDLRKSLAAGKGRNLRSLPTAELEYVLAKAYFHRGPEFRDLTIAFLQSSETYPAADRHEYLAMSWSSLGLPEKALAEFEEAMKTSPGPTLRIAAAREYARAGKGDQSEALLLDAIAVSSDALAREQARGLLADAYQASARWDAYEAQVKAMLTENPDSADAHFRLGLLYQARGDPVHARAEWRTAVTLDPMHAAARQKLAERL